MRRGFKFGGSAPKPPRESPRLWSTLLSVLPVQRRASVRLAVSRTRVPQSLNFVWGGHILWVSSKVEVEGFRVARRRVLSRKEVSRLCVWACRDCTQYSFCLRFCDDLGNLVSCERNCGLGNLDMEPKARNLAKNLQYAPKQL